MCNHNLEIGEYLQIVYQQHEVFKFNLLNFSTKTTATMAALYLTFFKASLSH